MQKQNMKNKPKLIPNSTRPSSVSSTNSGPNSKNSSQASEPGLPIPELTESLTGFPQSKQGSSSSPNPNPTTYGSKKSAGGRNYKFDKLKTGLVENIGGVGLLLYAIPRTQADGKVILEHTNSLSDKLVVLAKENEQVYNVLNYLVTGSAWAAVAGEVLAIGVAIGMNHGIQIPGLAAMGAIPGGNDQLSGIPEPVAA